MPYFYEPFLESFDPGLRKQLGVWYTPALLHLLRRVEAEVGMTRALLRKLVDAKHLWPERRTNGIKQVCKWPIARPLPGRAARRAHPPKLGEVGLDHRCQLQLCKRLKFPIFLFDGLRPNWTRFS